MNGGRPRTSAAIGGAIATGYQRGGGQTVVGASPVAAPRTAASSTRLGRPARTTGPACGRPPGGRPRRGGAGRPAATHVLPTSVPVPATRTSRSGRLPRRRGPPYRRVQWTGRTVSGHRRGRRRPRRTPGRRPADRPARRCGRPRGSPAAGWSPAGRWAGGWPAPTGPRSSSAADAATARSSRPSTTGTIGTGWPGARPARRGRPGGRRAPRPPPNAARRGRRGRPRRRPGRAGGREDVRPGQVDQEVDHGRGPASEAAEGAERLGQRPHPDHRDVVGDLRAEVGAEDGVGLVEHEQRAVAAAQAAASSATGATSPSIEKTVSVTTTSAWSATRRAARRGAPVGVPVDGELRPGPAGSRR